MARSKRHILTNGLLLVISLLVSIALAEAVIRSFVTLTSFEYISENGRHWNMPDPVRRYRLTSGFEGRLVSAEFEHAVVIDERGYRTTAAPVAEDTTTVEKIFVVGDSFTFGVGVPFEEAIPARLEHYLIEQDRAVKVTNLGVPGYAMQQYRYTLEDYLAYERPQVVVLCLYAGRLASGADDVTGSAEFAAWEAETREAMRKPASPSQPEKARKPSFSLKSWLERHSGLYNFVLLRVGPTLRAWKHSLSEVTQDDLHRKEAGWRIIEEQLADVDSMAQVHNFDMALVYIPEHSDVLNGYAEIGQRMGKLAEASHLPYVNGMALFEGQNSKDFYYPADGHLNASGYDLFAHAIATRLSQP